MVGGPLGLSAGQRPVLNLAQPQHGSTKQHVCSSVRGLISRGQRVSSSGSHSAAIFPAMPCSDGNDLPAGLSRRRGLTAQHAVVNPGQSGDSPKLPSAQGAEKVTPRDSHSGHAILHDFCMCIPYGIILGLAAIVSFFSRGYSTGLALLGASIVTETLASLSLTNWKRQQDSRLFTAASAGIALAVTVAVWRQKAQGIAAIAAYSLCGVSVLMLLFLLYNVAAGGNPPKKTDDPNDSLIPTEPGEERTAIPLSPAT